MKKAYTLDCIQDTKMSSSTLLFFFLFTFIHLLTSTLAQPKDCTSSAEYCWKCSDIGNYTANSIYRKNLNSLLLSNFSANDQNKLGFYNISSGQGSDKINAIGLCMGTLDSAKCQSCLNVTTNMILERCPNQKEAILWGEFCLVRYSNNSIFHVMKEEPLRTLASPNPAADANHFKVILKPLLDDLINKAASDVRKYALGHAKVPNSQPIYALVQCTPDLTQKQCSDCLQDSTLKIPDCCDGKIGARVLKSSCTLRYESGPFYDTTSSRNLRYEVNLFYQPTANKQPVMPNSPKVKKNNTSRTVTIVVVPSVVVVLVLIFCIRFYIRRTKITEENFHNPEDITSETGLQFNFNIIKDATNDFSEKNKLGQGGFGAVYKGRLLDGKEIAVKRPLSVPSSLGHGDREFKNEVRLVAKLAHRNLVSLQGFCLEKNERILVYEFVPNNSLDRFIFDPVKREHLDWGMRYRIIKGIARGLLYLHEESGLKIIHRDLKASNILLDAQMNPKISDFGTARLFILDQSLQNTKKIVGTRGYMAPEYAKCGQVSVKSDVFSFGVLVLEIVSGQEVKNFKNFHEGEEVESLLSYAWIIWKEGNASNLADPIMRGVLRQEMLICIHIGLL